MRSTLLHAALLIIATISAQSASQVSPASDKPRIVRLYMSETRALVMLRIGDAAPVPVVFDTGTNGNLLDTATADRLSLPNTGPSPSIDGSTGKPVPGHDSFIRGARLGGVAIPDARATALDYNQTDEIGIFGPNSFPDDLVEMDGPRSRLVVRRRTPAATPTGPSTAYLGDGGSALPSADIELGGIRLRAILDSGNDAPLILPIAYKDKLPLDAAPQPVGYAVSAAGKQPILMAHLTGSLRVGGVTVSRPEVIFMEGGRPNVGLPILRRIKVVYDHSGSRSWITSTGPITL